MAKVYDHQNNVMRTGVLYGISHRNRPKYWLSSSVCLTGVDEDNYGFCDDERGRAKRPMTAFRLFDNSWTRYKDIDTEIEYYIQQFVWNENKKEYEFYHYTWDDKDQKYKSSAKYYAKLKKNSFPIIASFKWFVSQPFEEGDRPYYKFKLFNAEGSSYVKIAFKNGPGETIDKPNYSCWYAAETKEKNSFHSNIESVRYQTNKDIESTYRKKDNEPERNILDERIRKEAECFIFEPVSNYYVSEIGRIGKDNGLLEFYRDDPEVKTIMGINQQKTEQIIYRLRATAINNVNLPIAAPTEEWFKIFADGKHTFSFLPTEPPSDLEKHIGDLVITGNNFVITNEPPIDIFKYEFPTNDLLEPSQFPELQKQNSSNGKIALILYKLGNTLLAKTEGPIGERTIMTGKSTDKWSVFVEDLPKYSFTGTDKVSQVVEHINTSIEFKGQKFHVVRNSGTTV
ncbi:hypothetical protein P4V47_06760 [Brevibacillus laterosporus]|uniref:hypothetical protein n=1 Tax=Brevibacillus laterosporus TaxID=1465 RepID=UPI002E21FEB7|nr:hypothetical protein [Brevibacillus laterosporus]